MKHSVRTSIETRLFYQLEAEAQHTSKARLIEEALRFYFTHRPPMHSKPTDTELVEWYEAIRPKQRSYTAL